MTIRSPYNSLIVRIAALRSSKRSVQLGNFGRNPRATKRAKVQQTAVAILAARDAASHGERHIPLKPELSAANASAPPVPPMSKYHGIAYCSAMANRFTYVFGDTTANTTYVFGRSDTSTSHSWQPKSPIQCSWPILSRSTPQQKRARKTQKSLGAHNTHHFPDLSSRDPCWAVFVLTDQQIIENEEISLYVPLAFLGTAPLFILGLRGRITVHFAELFQTFLGLAGFIRGRRTATWVTPRHAWLHHNHLISFCWAA